MARVRGRTRGAYETDSAVEYRMSVDKDRFAEAGFAWAAPVGAVQPQLPRGFQPRHVVGIDTAGRRCTAIVPHLTSTLWTGGATVFNVEGDDGVVYVATVNGRFGEKPSI